MLGSNGGHIDTLIFNIVHNDTPTTIVCGVISVISQSILSFIDFIQIYMSETNFWC